MNTTLLKPRNLLFIVAVVVAVHMITGPLHKIIDNA